MTYLSCILFLTPPCLKVWDSWFAEHCGLTAVIPTYTFSPSVNSRVPHGTSCPPLITYLTYSARLKSWDSCIPDGSAMQIVASGAHGLPWRSYVRSAISGGRCPALRLLYSSSAQKAEPFHMDVRSGVAVAINSTDAPCIFSPKGRGFAALYINCVLYSGARSTI